LSTSIAVFDETENFVLCSWPTFAFPHSLDPKRTFWFPNLAVAFFSGQRCMIMR
jgi:hypothetical protein